VVIRLDQPAGTAGMQAAAVAADASAHGAYQPATSELTTLGYTVYRVPAAAADAFLADLKALPGVAAADLDQPVSIADRLPNDPSWPNQYGPSRIQAPHAWDITTCAASVIIAIIDTGIDLTHPELLPKLWRNPNEIAGNGIDDDANGYVDDVNGWDFRNWDNQPADDHGHGTHVAGIAAALGNNATGIAGLAWGARIMPLKVLGYDGTGSGYDVAQAIIYATKKGAKVINLSLGGAGLGPSVADAVSFAYNNGVTVVAAAGNSGGAGIMEPANYPSVLAVAATDGSNSRAPYSSFGNEVDFAAPGTNILSTVPGGYGYMSGTSMATPHVSGAVALLASLAAFNSPDRIRQALTTSALDLGSAGWDPYYGSGLIQIYSAMQSTITPPPPPCTGPNCWRIFLPLMRKP
jgi:subtilisin family serine protease